MAARRMSLTTITSLWSQRSTNVPAIGLSSRFGSVAAKKTSPVANAEPVAVATTATSASWLNRSPKSEMSCPAHSAENEPLSASRTYGCWRTRSTVSGDGRGIGIVTVSAGAVVESSNAWSDGDARLAPALPISSGRSRATDAFHAGERPVS